MKKYFLAIVFSAISLCQTNAQNLRGGFGHAYFGTAMNISPEIQNDLSTSSLLGSDLQLNRLGVFGGGGGYGVFGRLLLGGSGLGYRVADATSQGQATLSLGGGFVNLGYIATLRENVMTFPYIGIGGKGMNLRVKNDTDQPFLIGNRSVAPGRELKLNSGGISFEAGYAVKVFTFFLNEPGSRHHGFIVGLQAGTYIFAGLEDWHIESSQDMVPSFSKAYSFSPYIRLTIGGGGFKVLDQN
ncbi:MAG TPA: hypothetical protein VGD40_26350 [Chryseosolibacter sp.]